MALSHAGTWHSVATGSAWIALAVLVILGIADAPRRTGDAHQYHAMAGEFAEFRAPSMNDAEMAGFKSWLAAQSQDSGFQGAAFVIVQSPLVVDGRQYFSHFWIFPLFATPFVWLARAFGWHEGYGFLALNSLLLAIAVWQMQRRFHPAIALIVLASPVVWFINKAQVELFTLAFLAIAMAQARGGRFLWAGLFTAIASTQNLPIFALVPCFWLAGDLRWHLASGSPLAAGTAGRGRRFATGAVLVLATIGIGALHPLYYLATVGVVTPQQLNDGIGAHLPSLERYLAVLIDPDIGLVPWTPLLVVLAAAGLIPLVMRHATTSVDDVRNLRLAAVCGLVGGVWFLYVFSQTTNVNSGGTVHVSRYVLWLIPLALPLVEATAVWIGRRVEVVLPIVGIAAWVWYAMIFPPSRAEHYLSPSPQSAFINQWLPGLYDQEPEIFLERRHGVDHGATGSAANAGCTVMIVSRDDPEVPCALRQAERADADRLFAAGWRAVRIVRPGPLHLGGDRVRGAIRG